MDQRPKVLIVDDRLENLLAVEAVLQPLDVEVDKARSAGEALRLLLNKEFAVILLDIEMPEIDGFQAAQMIRDRPRTRNTPIIFLTAIDRGSKTMQQGYELGAVDFLVKPFQPEILRWKVSVFAELFRKAEQEKELLREQMARIESEAIAKSAGLLADCSRALASTMDYEEMLKSLAHVLVPRFADAAAIYVCESQRMLKLLCAVGNHDEVADISLRNVKDPIVRAFRSDSTVIGGDTALYIPIRGRGCLGAMALYRDRGGFADADYVFADDLSGRVGLGVANAQLYEASQQANRAKDQFLAVVSHELRTPLTAILGWVHMLLSKQMDKAQADKALRIIERNARLQHDLIADILDFSGIVTGQLPIRSEDVNVRTIVEETLEAIRPTTDDKKIHLVPALADQTAIVVGDATRLQQIFSNLCSNAVKFTPEGGKVEVALAVTDGHVTVRVTDTGVGISADLIPRVFEPFVQGDSSNTRGYPGLGLGLAIVRRLVELHGGNIRVESAGPGHGASFSVTLPVKQAEARAS